MENWEDKRRKMKSNANPSQRQALTEAIVPVQAELFRGPPLSCYSGCFFHLLGWATSDDDGPPCKEKVVDIDHV